MSLKTGLIVEFLVTSGAAKWFVITVVFDVVSETGLIGEPLPALVTAIWLFPTVDSHVGGEA